MYPTMLTRLLHMCRVDPSSDSDKVKMTVTCSHYHIRAADAGLLKIDRCWASSPVLDNKLDESKARRQLKSPRSLSGRSLHLTLVTKWSRSHTTLKIQISRSWPRSEFSRCVCFSFRGNRTIFCWDIANSIFDLENSRSRSRPNPMVRFEA